MNAYQALQVQKAALADPEVLNALLTEVATIANQGGSDYSVIVEMHHRLRKALETLASTAYGYTVKANYNVKEKQLIVVSWANAVPPVDTTPINVPNPTGSES